MIKYELKSVNKTALQYFHLHDPVSQELSKNMKLSYRTYVETEKQKKKEVDLKRNVLQYFDVGAQN